MISNIGSSLLLSAVKKHILVCAPVKKFSFSVRHAASANELSDMTKDRIDGYVNDKKFDVVVFMKGTQQAPMCGFSRNVKLILDFHRVPFKDYNVLEDDDLREGIKQYSDWPTIPQVYVKAEFVGGSDVLAKMHNDGEITQFFDEKGIRSKFSDVLPETDVPTDGKQ